MDTWTYEKKKKKSALKSCLQHPGMLAEKSYHAIYRYNKQTTQINNDDNYQK